MSSGVASGGVRHCLHNIRHSKFIVWTKIRPAVWPNSLTPGKFIEAILLITYNKPLFYGRSNCLQLDSSCNLRRYVLKITLFVTYEQSSSAVSKRVVCKNHFDTCFYLHCTSLFIHF